jgi:NAD(P)-dependent dehydrogenase (short-subunit alcohol dehydrogenase family)
LSVLIDVINRFGGRIAIVTGADQPLGAACVARLAAEGAEVIAGGTDKVAGASVTCTHDGASEDSWQTLIDVSDARGGATVLVNADLGFLAKPFDKTSLAEVRALTAANVAPTWLGMRAAIPAIRRHGGGYIVNVISALGRTVSVDAAVFSALSGGLRIATKSAALECAQQEPRIMVNAVLVGAVDMPVLGGSKKGLSDLGLGPVIEADAVAASVAQLACADSAYVTGMEIYADGGYAAAPGR